MSQDSSDLLAALLANPTVLEHFSDDIFCFPFDEEFDHLLSLVAETFEWEGTSGNDAKGKRLEHLATYLLKRIKCVDVVHDLRVESNQIDHKVTLTAMAGFHPFLKEIGLNFISECKNQKGSIDVGQVQKVANLLDTHSINLGVFFSRTRIAGNGWKDAEGKRKKIYCKHGQAILIFTYDDLVRIKNENLNLITEMRKKYEQLKFEIENDDVSVEEDDWHSDPARIQSVLYTLNRLGLLSEQELSEKLRLVRS